MYSYQGYEVDAINGLVIGLKGKPIKKKVKGYVYMYRRNKPGFSCHRAVWIAVNGEIPESLQINHINGIKHDNRIENLELVTAGQNTAHAYSIGLSSAKGISNGRSILNEIQVREIKKLRGVYTQTQISKTYKVSRSNINAIFSGRIWKAA